MMVVSDADDSPAKVRMLQTQLQEAIKMAPSSSVPLMLSSSSLISQKLAIREEKNDEFLGKFVAYYIQAVAQCASKCRSDKLFDLKMTQCLTGCLVIALNDVTLEYVRGIIPPLKFQSLVAYLVEVCWSYLFRSVEISACEEIVATLRSALIQVHKKYLIISCIKGLEMSMRCLLLHIKSSRIQEAKALVHSWDTFFHQMLENEDLEKKSEEKKIFTLQEMQRIVLWNCECNTVSRTLSISDDYIGKRLRDILMMIPHEHADNISWIILSEIVHMELQCSVTSLSPPKDITEIRSKSVASTHKCRSVGNLSTVLKSINLEETDSLGLELLSRFLCLSVQSEVHTLRIPSIYRCSSMETNAFSSSSILLMENVSTLCTNAFTSFFPTPISKSNISPMITTDEKIMKSQSSSKYITFLARTYNSCLNWLQKFFQNKIKDKISQIPQFQKKNDNCNNNENVNENENNNLCILIIVDDLLRIIFKSMITSNIWMESGFLILATLRAVGNCLSHLPSGSFDGSFGVNICNGLNCTIVPLTRMLYRTGVSLADDKDRAYIEVDRNTDECSIPCDQKRDILTTLLTLTSLITGKCIPNKLYVDSSTLLVNALVTIDLVQISHSSQTDQIQHDHNRNIQKDEIIPKNDKSIDKNAKNVPDCYEIDSENCLLKKNNIKIFGKNVISMQNEIVLLPFTMDAIVVNRLLSSLIISCIQGVSNDVTDNVTDEVHQKKNNRQDIDQNGRDLITITHQNLILKNETTSTMMYKACEPLLRSTYGPEFLYNLCTEFILHVQDPRNYLSSSSNNVIHFITKLFLVSTESKKTSMKESAVMELYVRSHCLWAVSEVCGASDIVSARVIESLKSIGDGIDPQVMDTVAAVKGKGRTKRPLKTEKDMLKGIVITPTNAETMQNFAEDLRVWMLLALWGLPLTYSQSDVKASDGTHGITVYLTNALKALKGLAEVIKNEDRMSTSSLKESSLNRSDHISTRFSLSADCKTLYHMLGLSGRLKEQIEVTAALLVCSEIFNSSSSATRKEYNQTTQELLFFNDVRTIWLGDPITRINCTINVKKGFHKISGHSENKETLRGANMKCPDTPGQSISTLSPCNPVNADVGREIDNEANYYSGGKGNNDARTVCNFFEIVRALLYTGQFNMLTVVENNGEEVVDPFKKGSLGRAAAAAVAVAAKCADLQFAAEALLTSSPSISISTSIASTVITNISPLSAPVSSNTIKVDEREKEDFSFPLSSSLKSWISLLTAKTLLCVAQDHQNAYKWVRKALSYSTPKSIPDIRKSKSKYGGCLSVDRCLPRVEGILLGAELYEQTGNTDSCLAYISEATAIGKYSSQAVRSIVNLHSMRIWERLHSARFISALHDLSGGVDLDEYSLETSKDEVSKSVRNVAISLSQLLNVGEEVDTVEDGEKTNNQHMADFNEDEKEKLSLLSFKYLNTSWDFNLTMPSSTSTTTYPSVQNKKCYHTNISKGNRALFVLLKDHLSSSAVTSSAVTSSAVTSSAVTSSAVTSSAMTSLRNQQENKSSTTSARTTTTSSHTHVMQLLENLKNSYSFDILRDVRRAACLQTLKSSQQSSLSPKGEVQSSQQSSLSPKGEVQSSQQSSLFPKGEVQSSQQSSLSPKGPIQKEAMTQGQYANKSFHSFLLGVSSCSTAMECVMERQSTSAPAICLHTISSNCSSHISSSSSSSSSSSTSSRNNIGDSGKINDDNNDDDDNNDNNNNNSNNSSSSSGSNNNSISSAMADISQFIRAGCCGNNVALLAIEKLLIENLHFTQGNMDSVSFAVIEPLTGNLLLGRWDGEGSSVVCLPIAEELSSLISQWNLCMQKSKILLHRTSDVVQVSKWTDADKREWWAERMASDAVIESLLLQLESLLGPWVTLFSGQKPPFETDGVQVMGTTASGPLSSLTNLNDKFHSTDVKKKKESNTSIKDNFPLDVWGDSNEHEEFNLPKDFSGLTIKSKMSKCVKKTSIHTENVISPPVLLTSNICETMDEDKIHTLNSLKVTDLRQLLKDSKLSTVGKKSELITRLREFLNRKKCDVDNSDSSNNNSNGCGDDSNRNPVSRIMVTCLDHPRDVCTYEDPMRVCVRSADLPPGPENPRRERHCSSNVPSQHPVAVMTDDMRIDRVKTCHGSGDSFSDSSITTCPTAAVVRVPICKSESAAAGHTVLILDEQLQQIPWEALPGLRGKQCSRMPSFALLLHMLTRDNTLKRTETGNVKERSPKESKNGKESSHGESRNIGECSCDKSENINVNLTSPLRYTWYVLDPEGNLPATRETMMSFLKPYIDTYSWVGFVGEMPSEDTTKDSHNDSDLFIYCGHGAGEKICDSHKMRKWRCPSAMLWGCSSGRLSVPGVHDPQGPAVNYLIGGAQYVLANLWDVTDKDIDKLSMECMRIFFEGVRLETGLSHSTKRSDSIINRSGSVTTEEDIVSSTSLAHALATSRDVCKLKSAVGCAPVMYGIPRKYPEGCL